MKNARNRRRALTDTQSSSFLAILGLGNEFNGDDAAGVCVARALQERVSASSRVLIIDAGLAPENFTATLRRFHPELVIMVDAVDMGEIPGSIACLSWWEGEGWSGSTHTLPPNVLAKFLIHELGCCVILLAIQVSQTAFDTPLSVPVKKAVETIVRELLGWINE